ncbi:MAG TPA: hypothetical protein VL625_11155 [Patescibacteria group bacterium]|nr:hypothetical protein [Patescibacteria group bacterium]
MSDSLRPAWVIANQGKRLVNIETGILMEESGPNETTISSTVGGFTTLGTIDQPLDKVIKTMTRQGYVLKLF